MNQKEYEEMAKRICQEVFKKHKTWVYRNGNCLGDGYCTLQAEMSSRGIDLASDRAKETIEAYALGYFFGEREGALGRIIKESSRSI